MDTGSDPEEAMTSEELQNAAAAVRPQTQTQKRNACMQPFQEEG